MYFCKLWFRAKKRPIDILTEEQARVLHDSHQPYVAVLGPPEQPSCFIEITKNMVGVDFLDENLRDYLSYTFSEVQSDMLFLESASYRTYNDESDKVSLGTTYLFKTDGRLIIRRHSYDPNKLERAEDKTDVSGNYAARPLFGQYEEFTRKEREIPPIAESK